MGTSTASMGYQWVNYPTWIGFQWNDPGEQSVFIGACANDTPLTVPESLSWFIVAPLLFHQYTSVILPWMVPRIIFNWVLTKADVNVPISKLKMLFGCDNVGYSSLITIN